MVIFCKDSPSTNGVEILKREEQFLQVIRISGIGILDHDHLTDANDLVSIGYFDSLIVSDTRKRIFRRHSQTL